MFLEKMFLDFHLKTRKLLQVLMDFKNFIDESGCKPNKVWIDKGNKF